MNFEHLKVFYVAASHLSFSETAKIVNLSQPTVSLQIQQLESALNTKLFERTTKSVKLTDSGQLLFRYAEQIIQLVNKAKKELTLLSESIHGNLIMGASLTIAEYLLPYLLGKFSMEYPKVDILMHTHNSHQIVKDIINETIELGFIEAPIHHQGLYQHPFCEDELVIISSTKQQHPIIENKDLISTEELLSLPFILREPGSGTRQVIEDSLRNNHLDPTMLNVVLELGSTESIKAVVESGLGISIVSEAAIKKELKLGTLRKVKIHGINLHRFFYIVYDQRKVLSSPADAFLNFMIRETAGSVH